MHAANQRINWLLYRINPLKLHFHFHFYAYMLLQFVPHFIPLRPSPNEIRMKFHHQSCGFFSHVFSHLTIYCDLWKNESIESKRTSLLLSIKNADKTFNIYEKKVGFYSQNVHICIRILVWWMMECWNEIRFILQNRNGY